MSDEGIAGGRGIVGVATFVASVGVLLFGSSLLLRTLLGAGLVARPGADEELSSELELVQLGGFRCDQFLVDRSTGGVWHRVCSGNA